MSEAYYEEQRSTDEIIQYPFSCHLQTGHGRITMCKAHWHYYIEILYCVTGKAKIFIGGQFYTFKKGDLVLINGREAHQIIGDVDEGSPIQYIVLKFDPEVLYSTSKTIFESKYILPFTMVKSSYQKVFTEEEISNTPLPNLMHEILSEFKNRRYGFELAIHTHICSIFLLILRNWQEKGFYPSTETLLKDADVQRFQKIFDYIADNYKNDFTAKEVAKHCNMSYCYFSRYFKSVIGKTFTDYLNYIRITEAEKLLMTTDLNITQIALETGFSTSSYFIQQFKNFKNISPKQFKKKLT